MYWWIFRVLRRAVGLRVVWGVEGCSIYWWVKSGYEGSCDWFGWREKKGWVGDSAEFDRRLEREGMGVGSDVDQEGKLAT
jgi:hypothetical protein